MIVRRLAAERGRANFGWLDSRHSFSFGEYFDPDHMGFRALRVINDDRVKPGYGFPTHPHHNMEIISYVLEGALEHNDSMGTGSVIESGDVQRMSAGTGIRHSEMNPSKTAPVHFLQIWLLPDENGLKPEYEQKHFATTEKQGCLRLVVSRSGLEGALSIHQDVDVYAGVFAPGESATIDLQHGRHAWVQMARGCTTVNGQTLEEGDGAAVSEELHLELIATTESEILVFDLA
jgi:hypothetical protein